MATIVNVGHMITGLHVCIVSRAVTIHSCHNLIQSGHDPIRFTIHSFRPIFITQCHLNDSLKKITNKNNEHKVHHNTSASNVTILFMFDKNQFVGIS